MNYRLFCFLRWLGIIDYPKLDNTDLNNLLKEASKK